MAEASFDQGTVHGTCVVVGEAGVLIRGESGSGKSTLARELVHAARNAGTFAMLIGDDRVRLTALHGRVIARPVEAIAGLVEVRGHGLRQMAYEPAAVLRLVVDLTEEEPARLPDEGEKCVTLRGVMLPRLMQRRVAPACELILSSLSDRDNTPMTR